MRTMRRANRSGSATLGLAFFVMSLAIVPFSLKSWAYGTTFSPTLTAVIDVWRQISGFVGDGYPAPATNIIEPALPAGTHECAESALAAVTETDPKPGCDTGNPSVQSERSALPARINSAATKTEQSSVVAPRRASERSSDHKRDVPGAAFATAARVAVALAIGQADVADAEVVKSRSITFNLPGAEWRRSLSREIARHGINVAELPKSLGFPPDGRLLIKVAPAQAVPAPPSRRCNSSQTTTEHEQSFEYRFQLRGARELENHVLRVIGTEKKITAPERAKRSA